MKLLIMQFSPTSCHFIPLWYKYSPQHPVLKHPIFGPKRDEIVGDWSELHNAELHNIYTPPSIIRITSQG
jgi:hypothetical protein